MSNLVTMAMNVVEDDQRAEVSPSAPTPLAVPGKTAKRTSDCG
jgi:hypothetical protein